VAGKHHDGVVSDRAADINFRRHEGFLMKVF
jgi:hypothetical protein